MAFLIPDNLGSRKDIPDTIRRVARAFQVACEEDATVWYEPLFDPEGRHPHLVVLEPRIGIVVLEVLRGKDRSRLMGAVRGKVRVEVDGVEDELDNPLERADSLAETLRDVLTGHPTLSGVPVGSAAAFSGIDRGEADRLGLDRLLDLDVCLFKPDLDAAINDCESRRLLQLFTKAVGSAMEDELTEQQLAELRGVIHPDVVIGHEATGGSGSLFTAGTGTPDDAVKVLDRRQEAFAKSLGSGHRVIRGVAGSGKTLVLVHRARLLARLLPSRKILVTCFTRSLASELRDKLAEYPNVEVLNLDKLMGRAIRSAGAVHPGYDDGSGALVAQAALDAQRKTDGIKYRAVMIDEAQDFDTAALQFCVELLEATEPDEQDLIVVADSAQNIFRKDFRWKDAGIRAQGRTRLLRVNYRNTREILEFAHSFLTADPTISVDEVPDPEDELSIIPAESAERRGPPPTVTIARDADDEVRRVVDAVKQSYSPRASSRSVAVLHGDQQSGRRYLARLIVDALRQASIPTFWVTDPGNKGNRDRAGSADEPVIVSTIHSAKGLEFSNVVVCGLGAREDLTTARKLLYVGFTRAVDRLTVVAASDSPFRHDAERAAALV